MTNSQYEIGKVVKFHNDHVLEFKAEVTGFSTDESGESQVDYKVVELAPDYSGPIKVGTVLKLPRRGAVGTFTSPEGSPKHDRDDDDGEQPPKPQDK